MQSCSLDTAARIRSLEELDRLGDEIAELSAHLDAATGRLLDLIREFDARGGWNGLRSCAEWLSWWVGLDPGAARERVRVARALGRLPALAHALSRGELSYSKVRALTRVAAPETEARLLAVAQAGTAAHVERIVRGWRRVDRLAEAEETAKQHASRSLRVYPDEDGMVVLRGRLEPEVGALLLRALEAAREALYQQARQATAADAADSAAELPTMAQQQADALALLAESALRHGVDPGASGGRYQVVVHVDAAPLAAPDHPGQSVLEDGTRVSAETSRRLACDASRVVMRHDGKGRLLEVGARTRTIPPALRCALQHRDRGCRFPGCGAGSARGTTCATGRRAARPRSPTSSCSVAATTARSTKRATRSSGSRTARSGSGGRTAGHSPRPRERRRRLPIRSKLCGGATTRTGSASTRARHALPGLENGWTWVGVSTFCVPWPRKPRDRVRQSHTWDGGQRGPSSPRRPTAVRWRPNAVRSMHGRRRTLRMGP